LMQKMLIKAFLVVSLLFRLSLYSWPVLYAETGSIPR
jgi:hypothetical protein